MARADQNSLHRSKVELDRQQREAEPEVPGAAGSSEEATPEAARKASKRFGKTNKHAGEPPRLP
jgi:hypothetical protein